MKLILFLIKRLFTSKNSSLVFRLTNFITILSLSLGVASLSIVISSINGFESEISKKLSNLNSIEVSLVWEPKWHKDLMSEEAKLALDIF